MITADLELDHLVLAGPDLQAAVQDFARRSGVMPVPGGQHPGRGTANYLVGLGQMSYLEIIGPDPDQSEPAGPRPFGIDELDDARLVTWAVHPGNLDALVDQARRLGYDPGDPTPMSRRTPNGDQLQWRLTEQRDVVPFLIDWGSSAHPTSRDLPTVQLASLTLQHPDPELIKQRLAALRLDLPVTAADHPGLTADLETPSGPLTL